MSKRKRSSSPGHDIIVIDSDSDEEPERHRKRVTVRQYVQKPSPGRLSEIDRHRAAYLQRRNQEEEEMSKQAVAEIMREQVRERLRRERESIKSALRFEKAVRKQEIDRKFKAGRPEIYEQELNALDALIKDMERQALDDMDSTSRIGKRRPQAEPSSSAAAATPKRQRKQDPVEKALDEIEETVQQHPDHTSHRKAHRLKFLINQIKQHVMSQHQKERFDRLGAVSVKNGWRIPRLQKKGSFDM